LALAGVGKAVTRDDVRREFCYEQYVGVDLGIGTLIMTFRPCGLAHARGVRVIGTEASPEAAQGSVRRPRGRGAPAAADVIMPSVRDRDWRQSDITMCVVSDSRFHSGG
jgi:hypothetical protein